MIILRYKNLPSITAIKALNTPKSNCIFNAVSLHDIKKTLQNLDSSKATQTPDITTEITKGNRDFLSHCFQCLLTTQYVNLIFHI